MKLKLFVMTVLLIIAGAVTPAEAAPLKIVASQAFFADLVKQIGGERVEVKFVAPPKFNVHFIQPRPSDIRNLAQANLAVYCGLDLEAWWGPLVEAAGRVDFFPGRDRSVDLSRGIRILNPPTHAISRAEGDIHAFGNPHYQMDPRNALIMAGTIAERLTAIDPQGASSYEAALSVFRKRMEEKIAQWKTQCAGCAGKEVIAYHEDLNYLGDFLGVRMEQFLEPRPGIPPTPKQLVFLEEYGKTHAIRAIVQPTYYPADAAEAVAKKIGAKVITVAVNAGEIKGTEDVFGFFNYNIGELVKVLGAQ